MLAAAGPATAQEPARLRGDSAVHALPGIRVHAILPIAATGGAGAIVVELDSLVLAPAAPLDDVLRRLPLLHVRTNSRGEAEIVARGSESRQVAVLLDGTALTLGWDARTDVSVLSAAMPTTLRYYRGPSTMLHGPNTAGSAVELVTAGRPGVPLLQAAVERRCGNDVAARRARRTAARSSSDDRRRI